MESPVIDQDVNLDEMAPVVSDNAGPIMASIEPDGTRIFDWALIKEQAQKFVPGEQTDISTAIAYLLLPFCPESATSDETD